MGVLPRPHGSAVFTRGQTQVMTVATLAPVSEKQIIDGIGTEDSKRYMHHYNFPGYSTGEAKPIRLSLIHIFNQKNNPPELLAVRRRPRSSPKS